MSRHRRTCGRSLAKSAFNILKNNVFLAKPIFTESLKSCYITAQIFDPIPHINCIQGFLQNRQDAAHMHDDDMIDLKRLFVIMKRQIRLMVGILCLFMALAFGYLTVATPKYTAETRLFLDSGVTNTVSDLAKVRQTGFEDAAIDSEVEVINSRSVTDKVIQALGSRYFEDYEKSPELKEKLVGQLARNLRTKRVGESYVLSVSFESENPVMAADIANAYANAYIRTQRDTLADVSQRTATWLDDKIATLRKRAIESRESLSNYRTTYNTKKQEDGKALSSEVALSELRILEREAETYTELHNSYLEKLEMVGLEENYPITKTRVIAKAYPPLDKSHPKPLLVAGAAMILGLGTAVLAAIIRETMDRTLRRGGQVRRELGVRFLGFLPQSLKADTVIASMQDKAGNSVDHGGLCTYIPDQTLGTSSQAVRILGNTVDHALTSNSKKVIGILSDEHSLAKQIIASSVAYHLGHSAPCLLIEASSKPEFNKSKPVAFPNTLRDVVENNVPLKDAVIVDNRGKWAFLPPDVKTSDEQSPLTIQKVGSLMESAKSQFEYVVIDLPPMFATADLIAYADNVDFFVVVAEWGKTLSNSLNFYLSQNDIAKDKVLGVMLVDADIKKLEKLYGHKV